MLEQSVSELLWLKGATVVGIRERKSQDEYDSDCIEIEFRLTPAGSHMVEGDPSHALVEVWQDPEGNGPGFLALTATKVAKTV
jgi:hypothetical protein